MGYGHASAAAADVQAGRYTAGGGERELRSLNFHDILRQFAVCHASQDNSVNGPAQPATRGAMIRQINGLGPDHVTLFYQ
jgi:hypothetical protein